MCAQTQLPDSMSANPGHASYLQHTMRMMLLHENPLNSCKPQQKQDLPCGGPFMQRNGLLDHDCPGLQALQDAIPHLTEIFFASKASIKVMPRYLNNVSWVLT